MSTVIKKEHIDCLELLKETLEKQRFYEQQAVQRYRQITQDEMFASIFMDLEKSTIEELGYIDTTLNIENKIPEKFVGLLKKREQFDFQGNGFGQWELRCPSSTKTWYKDVKHYNSNFSCCLDYIDRYMFVLCLEIATELI